MKLTIELVRQIIAEKVTGKIIPCHNETGHYYKFVETGAVVSSVTTQNVVEKKHLYPWMIRMAVEWLVEENRMSKYLSRQKELEDASFPKGEKNEYLIGAQRAYMDVRDDAGFTGNDAHDVIEDYINAWIETGIKPADIRTFVKANADPRVIAVARSAENLFSTKKVIPVAAELLVGDEKWEMAGTLDLLVLDVSWPEFPQLELWDWKSSNQVGDDYARQVSSYQKLFESMTELKISDRKIVRLDKFSDKFNTYLVPRPNEAFKAQKGNNAIYKWQNNGKKKLVEDKTIIKL